MREINTGETVSMLRELTSRNKELREIEKGLEKRRKEFTSKERNLNSEKNSLDKREKELNKNIKDIQSYENELQKIDKRLQKDKEFIEKQFKEHDMWEYQREKVYDKLLAMEEDVKEREYNISEIESSILQKEKNLDQGLIVLEDLEFKEKEVRAREVEIANWDRERKAIEEQFTKEKKTLEKEIKTIKAKISEIDERENKIQKDEQRIDKILHEDENIHVKLHEEIEKSNKLKSILKEKEDTIKDMTMRIEKTVVGLSNRINEYEKVISHLENDRNLDKEKIKQRYEQSTSELKSQIDELMKEKEESSSLTKNITLLKTELHNRDLSLGKKDKEYKEIRKNLENALSQIKSYKHLEKDKHNIANNDSDELNNIPIKKYEKVNKIEYSEEIKNEGINIHHTNSKSTAPMFDRALASYKIGKYKKAIRFINNMSISEQNQLKVKFLKGKCLSFLEEYNEAIENYEYVLKSSPQEPKVLLATSAAYMLAGNPSKAIEHMDIALSVQPRDPDSLFIKGDALQRLGKHEESIEYYDRILEVNARSADAMISKGIALSKLHDYEHAKTCYLDSLQLEPDSLDALIGLGHIQYNNHMYADAMRHVRKAIRLDPGNSDVRELMNSLIDISRKNKKAII